MRGPRNGARAANSDRDRDAWRRGWAIVRIWGWGQLAIWVIIMLADRCACSAAGYAYGDRTGRSPRGSRRLRRAAGEWGQADATGIGSRRPLHRPCPSPDSQILASLLRRRAPGPLRLTLRESVTADPRHLRAIRPFAQICPNRPADLASAGAAYASLARRQFSSSFVASGARFDFACLSSASQELLSTLAEEAHMLPSRATMTLPCSPTALAWQPSSKFECPIVPCCPQSHSSPLWSVPARRFARVTYRSRKLKGVEIHGRGTRTCFATTTYQSNQPRVALAPSIHPRPSPRDLFS
ncbi:hypothetical protein C8Q76DRAFT_392350 [Earliella scabrosa]|nr:hypothetical protein C8Q76DRAFT_392350 [Earliella scabrosa]